MLEEYFIKALHYHNKFLGYCVRPYIDHVEIHVEHFPFENRPIIIGVGRTYKEALVDAINRWLNDVNKSTPIDDLRIKLNELG